MDEDALEQQALDEILKETKKSAERAKEMGALGWTKCPLPSTNKTFLKNMLVSTLRNINSPKSRNRARGRENFDHRDYHDTRERRYSDRHDDRRDKHDSYNKRENKSSRDRDSSRISKKHKKVKKSKKEGKSEKHKSKHSKSRKSKKSKDKNKIKDASKDES
ncbi:protein POLR1D [Patella vulgata]|uniref:protein POLR1D n=1 Tax=Patella vulgata TaxID=6465 RepID=UPI0021802B5C|nr:protein POLR1D [Patella vulgata]